MRTLLRMLAILALLAPFAEAQSIELPHATGNLTAGADWVVLRAAELDADERDSDPENERARNLLLGIVNELRQQRRTGEHLLLHQPGADASQLRVISAYSAAGATTSEELLAKDNVDRVRELLLTELANGASDVRYVTSGVEIRDHSYLFLEFSLTRGDQPCVFRQYLMPAGDRLQYFETFRAPDDGGAVAACDEVLATFDGIAPGTGNSSWPLVLGGMSGAVLGIVTALIRRRRQVRRLLAQQAATNPEK